MVRKKRVVQQATTLKAVAEYQVGQIRGLATRIRDELGRTDLPGKEMRFWNGITQALDASAEALAEAASCLNLHQVKRWRVAAISLAATVGAEMMADGISEQVVPAAKAVVEALAAETETLPTGQDSNQPTGVGTSHDAETNVGL